MLYYSPRMLVVIKSLYVLGNLKKRDMAALLGIHPKTLGILFRKLKDVEVDPHVAAWRTQGDALATTIDADVARRVERYLKARQTYVYERKIKYDE